MYTLYKGYVQLLKLNAVITGATNKTTILKKNPHHRNVMGKRMGLKARTLRTAYCSVPLLAASIMVCEA